MANNRIKKDYEAFLDGYKPALLIKNDAKIFSRLVEKYPSVLAYKRKDFDMYLFFQTEKCKKKYLHQNRRYEEDTYEDHYLLGVTLGFPKKSVEFFSELYGGRLSLEEQQEKERYKVGIRWAGFCFSTHLDLIEQEIDWLWNQYLHPKSENQPLYVWDYEENYLEVPYRNLNKLREVCEYIRKKRGLIPTYTNK